MIFNSIVGFVAQFLAIGVGMYLIFPPRAGGATIKGVNTKHATRCAMISANVLLVMFLAQKAFGS